MVSVKQGKLEGEVAIVTGGALGLGDGIVTKFVAEGAKVVILDWNIDSLKDKPARPEVVVVQGDVSKAADWEKALQAAIASFGRLTIVVNNAGIVSRDTRPTHEADITELNRLLTVNLKGIFVAVQTVVPYWLKEGAAFPNRAIVNTTSTSASRPRPGLSFYTASKAAAEGATKSLAIEYAPFGIRVNGVAPVIANTTMNMALTGGVADDTKLAQLATTIPLGRIAQPSDIANMVAQVACSESSFLTGQVIAVDGGRTI